MVKVITDDMTLLREYARCNSEEAFAALVSRHINLVYSVALRDLHDPYLAEEVTQVVFIILARKAESLSSKIILSGWLCRTARYASANALTIQRRRQQREQEAYMQSNLNQSDSDAWTQIAPLLGGAMEQLSQKDHDAVVLRFFEGKSFQEIGTAFGASENAAKKRVAYALEKLRKYFYKRGVILPATVITAAISANSVQAAPGVLAKTATAVAIAKGAMVSVSALTLIKGALKVMAWSKAKTAIITGVVVLLAVGGGTAIYETQQNLQSVTTGSPADITGKWVAGKKYEFHAEVNHSAKTKSPGQSPPMEEGWKWTQDFNASPLKQFPEGGWQVELEFMNETMDASLAGSSTLSFDSAQSEAGTTNNPWVILGALVGVRLEYFTDAEGKVQMVEGMKELTNRIAAIGTQEQRKLFNDLFGGDKLKDYLAIADWMPNRIVKVGESWSVKTDVANPIGMLVVNKKFTFKNWEQHGDHKCAHIEGTGSISSKSVSTASGAMVKIESGKISDEIWFDPEFGMLAEVQNNEDYIVKITTRTQTMMNETHDKTRLMLVEAR
jgi:RNA polymerase sigma factor (sigma-70 family)